MTLQYGRPAVCAALIGVALYVAGNVAAPAQSGQTKNVSLIQQDQSDCTNTTVKGTILARGGKKGGNGGHIETSGHVLTLGSAVVDASAASAAPAVRVIRHKLIRSSRLY